jgi:hypothetical protein
MNCTRPGIIYSVNKLSGFINNQSMDNWNVVNMFLKYLKCILDYKLYYIGYLSVLERYSDTSYTFNTKDSKSTREYAFILGRAVVSWKSFEQRVF